MFPDLGLILPSIEAKLLTVTAEGLVRRQHKDVEGFRQKSN